MLYVRVASAIRDRRGLRRHRKALKAERGLTRGERLRQIWTGEEPELPPLPESIQPAAPAAETLLGADVVLRADENDHWSWRFAARITGCFKRVRVPPDVRKKVVDKDAASRSIGILQTLPIKRLIVSHGHVIDAAPVEQLVEAWRLVGVDS